MVEVRHRELDGGPDETRGVPDPLDAQAENFLLATHQMAVSGRVYDNDKVPYAPGRIPSRNWESGYLGGEKSSYYDDATQHIENTIKVGETIVLNILDKIGDKNIADLVKDAFSASKARSWTTDEAGSEDAYLEGITDRVSAGFNAFMELDSDQDEDLQELAFSVFDRVITLQSFHNEWRTYVLGLDPSEREKTDAKKDLNYKLSKEYPKRHREDFEAAKGRIMAVIEESREDEDSLPEGAVSLAETYDMAAAYMNLLKRVKKHKLDGKKLSVMIDDGEYLNEYVVEFDGPDVDVSRFQHDADHFIVDSSGYSLKLKELGLALAPDNTPWKIEDDVNDGDLPVRFEAVLSNLSSSGTLVASVDMFLNETLETSKLSQQKALVLKKVLERAVDVVDIKVGEIIEQEKKPF